MTEVVVLPPSIAQQVRRAKALSERLEERLRPLLRLQPDEISKMTAQQQAELHLVTAQGLAAIYELFAKVSGTPIDGFEKEQARLERYAKKVGISGNELDLSQSSRSLTVDVAAANRFIDALIPDLDRQQRAESQEASKAAKRQKFEAEEAEARETAEKEKASKAAAQFMSVALGLNR